MEGKATDPGGGGDAEHEDVDVVWAGSPLDEHLKSISDDLVSEEDREIMAAFLKEEESLAQNPVDRQATTEILWPDIDVRVLEVSIAQKIINSELLVIEDDEFLKNFVLTDDALERYEKWCAQVAKESDRPHSTSYLSEAVILTGSLACVAGAVMYLSERARIAATVAAVLPTALAAATAMRPKPPDEQVKRRGDMTASSIKRDISCQQPQFDGLVNNLLNDMKMFKQLVRKSLNLLQGMELMHSGYLFAVNSDTGAPSVNLPSASNTQDDPRQSPVAGALRDRPCFPALRIATYKATVCLIRSYRSAVARLLEVSPLSDHIDLREHYLAFIDLAHFGIADVEKSDEREICSADVTVKVLKDVVQLALIQQSEYLRRFALAFSAKARDEDEEAESSLNKTGLLDQVRALLGNLHGINRKLSRVFDYHQAMGIVPDDKQTFLAKKNVEYNLAPLRSVYTSLFSTGLHLQNSLLKVRELERNFDAIEKRKTKDTDMLAALLPSNEHLIDWLRSFKAIQNEINACVGCLDEGLAQIDLLNAEEEKEPILESVVRKPDEATATEVASSMQGASRVIITESTEIKHEDEVFEAVIHSDEAAAERKKPDDEDPATLAEQKRKKQQREQSERLLKELRLVLVDRAARTQEREAKALSEKHESSTLPNMDELSPEPVEALKEVVEQIVEDQTAVMMELQSRDPFLYDHLSCKPLGPADTDCFGDSFVPKSADLSFDNLKSALSQASTDADELRPCAKDFVSKSPSIYLKSHDDEASSSEDEDNICANGAAALTESDSSSSASSSSSSSSSSLSSTSSIASCSTVKSKSRAGQSTDSSGNLSSNSGNAPASRLKKLRQRDNHVAPRAKCYSEALSEETCSYNELRSISSPDIKRLLQQDVDNPYVSLERLSRSRRNGRTKPGDLSPRQDDDPFGSADEMGHQVLKTYKRPLRPGAHRHKPKKRDSEGSRSSLASGSGSAATAAASASAQKARKKRERNRTRSIQSDELVEASAQANSYVERKNKEGMAVFLPNLRATGFEASLAQQAAAKAVNGFNGLFKPAMEEVFGAPDSD